MATLVKIDRNGSKHFEGMVKCDRCGGDGKYKWGAVINGAPQYVGDCFKCEGTGRVFDKWIERTPEYEALLAERRMAKAEASRLAHFDELATESLAKLGFNANGEVWAVLGDTYSIKEELKELGAKYNPTLGWNFDHEVEGYKTVKFDVNELTSQNNFGVYEFNSEARELVNSRKSENEEAPTSEYIGTVGDKFDALSVTYVKTNCWDSIYGVQYLHTFSDVEGNVIVWKSVNPMEITVNGELRPMENNSKITLKGTIKDHSEYRAVKQTVVTRCKVVAVA